jgi:hypothetical protein
MSRWRSMMDEEWLLAIGFSAVSELERSPFALDMSRKARANESITDRQGEVILAIARQYGLTAEHGLKAMDPEYDD